MAFSNNAITAIKGCMDSYNNNHLLVISHWDNYHKVDYDM